jgi:hypothetical protein
MEDHLVTPRWNHIAWKLLQFAAVQSLIHLHFHSVTKICISILLVHGVVMAVEVKR